MCSRGAETPKSNDVERYTERQVNEMDHGVHRDLGILYVDGDYPIEVKQIVLTGCVLEKVSYIKQPTVKDLETNWHNRIQNIKSLYVKNYYVITREEFGGNVKHDITRYLHLVSSVMRKGRREYEGLYGILKDGDIVKSYKNGSFPAMLHHPVETYITKLFSDISYSIEFEVETNIEFLYE